VKDRLTLAEEVLLLGWDLRRGRLMNLRLSFRVIGEGLPLQGLDQVALQGPDCLKPLLFEKYVVLRVDLFR
jgi:hypothetical protein